MLTGKVLVEGLERIRRLQLIMVYSDQSIDI